MELKTFFAQDTQGNIQAETKFFLYQVGTSTLATGLRDEKGATLPNPFMADTTGKVQVAAPNGRYDLRGVKGSVDYTMQVHFFDASEGVAAASASAAQAKASADAAAAVVTGGTGSLTPAPGKLPVADGSGKLAEGWLPFSTSGQTVATGTPAQGRTALGLGTAATTDVTTSTTDGNTGRVMRVGDFGIGGRLGLPVFPGFDVVRRTGNYMVSSGMDGLPPDITGSYIMIVPRSNTFILIENSSGATRRIFFGGASTETSAPGGWTELRHTSNTTVDSNGFLKNASPILKLRSDRIETEIEAPSFERIGTGHYQLSNTNGLRLDDGWHIETPHDRNKVPYFNVEWEQDIEPETDAGILEDPADVTLSIRCYERVWNAQTGQYDNGDPVDIPDGRWIDLRMNEVRVEEPEIDESEPEQEQQPPEPTEPVIPSVVTMAQAKLALLYAGLYEQAEAFINDLPEPQKAAALIEWNHRQTLEREHPLVAQVADGLGLTEEQLDDLFVDAGGR